MIPSSPSFKAFSREMIYLKGWVKLMIVGMVGIIILPYLVALLGMILFFLVSSVVSSIKNGYGSMRDFYTKIRESLKNKEMGMSYLNV